jgi:hypothetical protein
MRKLLIATAIGAGLCVGAVAVAANSDDLAPQARAYMNYGFGGKDSSLPRNFHYGLRLDQDTRLATRIGRESMPSIMQLDFNAKSGFESARVNGVPFASRSLRLNEDGTETSYSVLDWGLLAVGVVGLGFGIAEVVKTKESDDPKTTGTSTGGGTTGGTPTGGTTTGGTPTGGTTGGLLGTGLLGFTGASYSGDRNVDAERQAWLDGGTGHMGDLNPVR